jgi:hypothetical protein
MPAQNNPHYGMVRTPLPQSAQPVTPIYQPEVAARAVVWAAHHRRREVNVGLSTLLAVVGNKLMPGVLDHYLGRTGYASQQTGEAEDPGRPDNLWQPVDGDGGDHGAHGSFDGEAHDGSAELWAVTHPTTIAAAGLGAGVAGAAAVALLRSRSGNGSKDSG